MRKVLVIAIFLIFPAFLFSGCSKEEKKVGFEKVSGKILLFGIDGATWDVIDPLLNQGKLPNLKKLIRNGSRANLKTLKPTHSPRIWNTITTGVTPEVHGIESFTVKVPGTKETALPSSNMRKVKALWNIFSEFGYRVGIVGWWASFPAEKVNGFIISDHANYIRKSIYKGVLNLTSKGMSRKEEGEIYPPELYDEISNFIRIPTDVDPELLKDLVELPPDKLEEFRSRKSLSRENRLSVLKFSLLSDESFTASGLYALKKYQPDFMAFYISGLDAVEHHFWKFFEPKKYKISIPEEEILLYKNVIINYYIYVDKILGKFLSLYPEDEATIIVISDHGHEANPNHGPGGEEIGYARFASGFHDNAPDGILVISGKDIRKGATLKKPSVLDITPTLLYLMGLPTAKDMPGKVLKRTIRAEFEKKHITNMIPTYSSDRKYSSTPVRSEMDKVLKEKLRALGYIN